MILTVTLNPAIDVTYHVDALTPGQTHRVSRVDERLGGKGVNVASVLGQLDVPVKSTGLLKDGPELFAPIAAPPRRTVVVADGSDATGFWEPAPPITPAEWAYFTVHFVSLLQDVKVVVLAGSLPESLPPHAYASLIGLARHAGCRTILDTSGPALTHGLAAGPDVVKPNAIELTHLGDAVPATTTVVQSLGAQGLRAHGWHARPPVALTGNPTGAGDACVAALARGLLHDTPWPALLRDAAALSAAAVTTPVAGQVDLDLYQKLLPEIIVEES